MLKSKFIVLALTLFGLLFIDVAHAQWSLGSATATSLNAGTINVTDSLKIGSTGDVWARKMFYNAADSSVGMTFYNNTLARLDTVYLYQKKY